MKFVKNYIIVFIVILIAIAVAYYIQKIMVEKGQRTMEISTPISTPLSQTTYINNLSQTSLPPANTKTIVSTPIQTQTETTPTHDTFNESISTQYETKTPPTQQIQSPTTITTSPPSTSPPSETRKDAAIEILSYPKDKVLCYDKIEILFNVTGLKYSNPFNQNDIDVNGYIYTPDQNVIKIPAFYTRNYTIQNIGLREHVVTFNSQPLWALRFTPKKVGMYRIVLEAKSRNGLRVLSEEIAIYVPECKLVKGFISIDKSRRYLVFDDGSSEIMLGINLAWPPSKSEAIFFYKSWFEKLKNLGVKVVRIGLVPWALNLEWSSLNRYSLSDAARIDEIIKLAEEHNIYLIFVFMWHNELADNWGDNPYNSARKGPLKQPEEFWSNREAIEIFKNKVRYMIARWSYSPNILAWELINEADLTLNFFNAKDSFVSWVEEISRYVKSLDPYKRLVTVNLADYNSEPRIWQIDSIDLITVHRYGPTGFKDIGISMPSIIESLWSKYKKPVIITEFGVDYRWIGMPGFTGIPFWAFDKEGVGLHEGLWSSILSGSPISAMSWWWDTQIEKYNLFYHFKALAEFLKNIDPVKNELRKIDISIEPVDKKEITSITLYPNAGWIWYSPTQRNIYTIYPNGSIEGDLSLLSGFVYGKSHSQRTLNPIFIVTFLEKGRVVININSVGRGSAAPSIYVNGSKILELNLPDIDQRSDEAANEYNKEIVLELNPGTYEIKIDNEGMDWYTWDYIKFENIVYSIAKVQALGLGNKTFAIMWIRNRDFNWWNYVMLNKSPLPLKNIAITLDNLEDGKYIVEFWNTFTGSIIEVREIKISQSKAVIKIEVLEKDLALKIYKVE